MLNALGLGLMFTARDLATGTINRVSRSMTGLDAAAVRATASYQRNFAVMGAGLGILGVGAASLAGAFALANAAGEFERGIARVGAISRASAEDMMLLHDAAIQAGIATQFSPTEAVEGLAALAAQGLNARESIAALVPALDLAAGGGISVESATRSMAAAINIFGISVNDAGLVADQFLRISNSTALEASDLQNAMANISRGAIAAGQGLEEMLPAIGLVRNTGAEASVAAHGVSAAIARMASRRADFDALGVSITDASGNFRPFLDVVYEADQALGAIPNAADRAARAEELFGRFGVGAFRAISTSISRGVRDSEGNLYTGAAAVTYLRDQMLSARGAAEEFRNAMLDTFEGQKTLLQGSMQTLAVVLGESFTVGLRPLVEGVLGAVNSVIGFLQSIPAEARNLMARFAVGMSIGAIALGAFVASAALLALVTPFLGAMASAAGSLMLALLPFAGAAAVITGLGLAVRHLYESDIGGFATWARDSFNDVRLGFEGLVQLFTTGSFSGAVMDEMHAAGNDGIRQFVIDIYRIGFRVMSFLQGIGEGISVALEAAGPTITVMVDSFTRLGRVLGILGAEGASAVAGMPSKEFMSEGARFGVILGRAFEFIAHAVTSVVDFTIEAIAGFRDFFSSAGMGVSFLMPAIDSLSSNFGMLFDTIGATTGGSMSFGELLGGFVASSIDLAAAAIAGVVWGISGMIRGVNMAIQVWGIFTTAMEHMREVFGAFATAVLEGFRAMALGVVVAMGEIMNQIPEAFRPAFVSAATTTASAGARDAVENVRTSVGTIANAARDTVGVPAAATAASTATRDATTVDALNRVTDAVGRAATERGPFNIAVQVDGESIARASVRGAASNQAGAFAATGEPPP